MDVARIRPFAEAPFDVSVTEELLELTSRILGEGELRMTIILNNNGIGELNNGMDCVLAKWAGPVDLEGDGEPSEESVGDIFRRAPQFLVGVELRA